MKLSDFRIKQDFYLSGEKWRCTDIGTRTIAAIKLNRPEDESWYNGPPYAVVEALFDEFDIEGCSEQLEEE
jgi:hypothetical protein